MSESSAVPSQLSEEQVEHVSDAMAEVSSALGIERYRQSTMRNLSRDAHEQQKWRVERLERAHEHLRAALIGTPRERPTPEQIKAIQEASR